MNVETVWTKEFTPKLLRSPTFLGPRKDSCSWVKALTKCESCKTRYKSFPPILKGVLSTWTSEQVDFPENIAEKDFFYITGSPPSSPLPSCVCSAFEVEQCSFSRQSWDENEGSCQSLPKGITLLKFLLTLLSQVNYLFIKCFPFSFFLWICCCW